MKAASEIEAWNSRAGRVVQRENTLQNVCLLKVEEDASKPPI